jgi:hypothetical protein
MVGFLAHEEGRSDFMDLGPDVETRHHHRTGRAWVDVVLGVSAVAISLTSLLLAVGNGNAMQRLVQANSWPFVSLSVSNRNEAGDKLLRLVAQNKGVGPARVQTLEVFYDGKPMSGPRTLIHAILGPAANDLHIPFDTSAIVGEVLSSKELAYLLTVKDKSISPEILEKLSNETKNIGFRTCYCSVFDECWISDRTGATLSPPQAVKSCPAPETPYGQ